jgi:hypothetical protein
MDDLTAHDSWVLSGSLCGWVTWQFRYLNWSPFYGFHRIYDSQLDGSYPVMLARSAI